MIKVHYDVLTDFLVQPLSCTIAYLDPDIAEKRLGGNNPLLLSWHGPRDSDSILLTVISIVYTTILSVINTAIASLSEPSQEI